MKFSILFGVRTLLGTVVSEMKMGNIVPRAGIKSKSLAFQASVLPLQYVVSLMSPQ